jgi:hypothetical protein
VVATGGSTIRNTAVVLLIRIEVRQTDSEDQHVVIHWQIARRLPVNNSTEREAISAASTAEKQATVAVLAVAAVAIAVRLESVRRVAVERAPIDLVEEEIAAVVELPVAVKHARASDLAAQAIGAVVVAENVLGIATLALGIEAALVMVRDTAAAVRAPAGRGVLPTWAVLAAAVVVVAVEVSVVAAAVEVAAAVVVVVAAEVSVVAAAVEVAAAAVVVEVVAEGGSEVKGSQIFLKLTDRG